MKSFKEHLTENRIDEFRDAAPSIPNPTTKPKPINKRTLHKDIDKLWDKFLKDATKLGYVAHTKSLQDTIQLHSTKTSKNDISGMFTLKLPKNFG